jgi:hypothetical protein
MTHLCACSIRKLAILTTSLCLLSLSSCKKDRTTIVFGKVVDQNQQPVDSIMVLASGVHFLSVESLQSTYTDKDGNYELVINAPKRYNALTMTVPYLPVQNPKFQESYRLDKVFRDGKRTGDCCPVTINQKTQWDFELAPK